VLAFLMGEKGKRSHQFHISSPFKTARIACEVLFESGLSTSAPLGGNKPKIVNRAPGLVEYKHSCEFKILPLKLLRKKERVENSH